jgi:carbon-monoxide dehydrogenase small subunit
MKFHATVNDVEVREEIEPRRLLAHTLRDALGLTGVHIGCDTSQCGACTVLIDDKTARSCTVLAAQAHGHAIRTIEGLHDDPLVTVLKQSFNEMHGLQCGYCTPAMVISARALLMRVADPSEHEVREALHGNLCRCTGYQNIVAAILLAAETLRHARAGQKEGVCHG